MFDGKREEAGNDISTVKITSHNISKILTIVNGSLYIEGNLKVEYKAGGQTTVYHKGSTNGNECVREIPDGYHIVGFYGRLFSNDCLK